MTIDEAIKNREECLQYLEGIGQKASPDCMEAVRWSIKALKALCPVSREQVENAYSDCSECSTCKLCIWNETKRCNNCHSMSLFKPLSNFCPKCGKPLTDEALEMVMERLEERRR